MKKYILILVAIILLLGGCMELHVKNPAATQTENQAEVRTETPVNPAAAPSLFPSASGQTNAPADTPLPLPLPLVSGQTNVPTDIEIPTDKMLYSADDIAQVEAFWPLKVHTLSNIEKLAGRLSTIDIDEYGKTVDITYWFESNDDFDSVCKQMKSIVYGKWEKASDEEYVTEGKIENRSAYCSVLKPGAVEMMISFQIPEVYNEADKLLGAHWTGDNIGMPDGMGAPSERDEMLAESWLNYTYTWTTSDYADIFKWFSENMANRPDFQMLPADDTSDAGLSFSMENGEVTIKELNKAKTISVGCMLFQGVKF